MSSCRQNERRRGALCGRSPRAGCPTHRRRSSLWETIDPGRERRRRVAGPVARRDRSRHRSHARAPRHTPSWRTPHDRPCRSHGRREPSAGPSGQRQRGCAPGLGELQHLGRRRVGCGTSPEAHGPVRGLNRQSRGVRQQDGGHVLNSVPAVPLQRTGRRRPIQPGHRLEDTHHGRESSLEVVACDRLILAHTYPFRQTISVVTGRARVDSALPTRFPQRANTRRARRAALPAQCQP